MQLPAVENQERILRDARPVDDRDCKDLYATTAASAPTETPNKTDPIQSAADHMYRLMQGDVKHEREVVDAMKTTEVD